MRYQLEAETPPEGTLVEYKIEWPFDLQDLRLLSRKRADGAANLGSERPTRRKNSGVVCRKARLDPSCEGRQYTLNALFCSFDAGYGSSQCELTIGFE